MVDVPRLGSAAMAGGAGLIVANLLMLLNADARGLESAGDWLVVGVLAVAVLLTLAGLFGVHLRERETYGKLGFAAIALALLGQAFGGFANIRLNEWLVLVAIVSGLVGFVLLTFAIARAPVLPAWSGYLLLIGWVGLFAVGDGDLGIALDGVAWLIVGYALRSDWETAPAPQPLGA